MAVQKIGTQNFSFCDAGCGNGIYLKFLADKYPKALLFGFDFSETIVEIARRNTINVEIKSGNLEAAP